MKEKNYGVDHVRYYRHPKTTQERRMSYAHGEYVRGKRRGKNLPHTYDDIHVGKQDKCWKNKRAKQYRTGKRGQKREIFLDNSVYEWYIIEYLKEQDIPHRIVDVREGDYYISWYDGRTYFRSFLNGYILTYWSDEEVIFPAKAFRERTYIFR